MHAIVEREGERHGRAPRLSLHLDGVDLGVGTVSREGRAVLRYPIPVGMDVSGINEVWIWVDEGAVLLTRLRILDTAPPPSVRQAERNRRLLRERRRALGRNIQGE